MLVPDLDLNDLQNITGDITITLQHLCVNQEDAWEFNLILFSVFSSAVFGLVTRKQYGDGQIKEYNMDELLTQLL